jgi:hypothetical protein
MIVRVQIPATQFELSSITARGTALVNAHAMHLQASIASLEDTLQDPALTEVHAGTLTSGAAVRVLKFNVVAASDALRRLHARLHPLMRFYIDGASELEQDDERMEALLAVQLEGGKVGAVVGMLTYFKCAPHLRSCS